MAWLSGKRGSVWDRIVGAGYCGKVACEYGLKGKTLQCGSERHKVNIARGSMVFHQQ